MKKDILIAVLISVILGGLAGFYAGRYYERTSVRNRFVQMRGNLPGGGQGGFRRSGSNPDAPSTSPTPAPTAPTQ